MTGSCVAPVLHTLHQNYTLVALKGFEKIDKNVYNVIFVVIFTFFQCWLRAEK